MPEPRPLTLIAGAARMAVGAGKRVVVGGVSLVGEIRQRLGERQHPEPREPRSGSQPERAPDGVAASGFPEPPGKDPGDISKDPSPYRALSNPVVDDPDLTEWPDPYDQREDPRDPADPDGEPFGEEPHPATGSTSTSEPHPSEDLETGDRWEGPKRDKLDQ